MDVSVSDKAWALLAVCTAQGRITSHSHAIYLNQALADYPSAVKALAATPVGSRAKPEPQVGGTFDQLRKEAPAVLEKMRANEPARYEALKDLHVASLKGK